MNVLAYAPQMAAYGGMERHVCDLAAVLAGRGHRVTLLTTSNSLAPSLRDALRTSGVSLRELPVGRGQASRVRKLFWLLREALRREAGPWDLIYTNGQSALARLAWMAAGPHTRIVHHHHTAGDAAEQATWSGAFRRVLRAAPEIVACSRATQQALAAALQRADIAYLPYLTSSPVAGAAVHDRAIAPGAPLKFGFTGRLVAEKGVAHLCELSRRPELQDVAWHIHGAGPAFPPAFFAAYPNMTYHGAYSAGASQAAVLQALDAVVLLSRHNEGMPLSLIEAMSAGLPWIATDRGGTAEIAVSPANALVVATPATLDQFAAAVRELANRIRSGRTSRVEQRRAYDRVFAPPVVSAAWCDFLERRQARSAA
jgi:glycosyltransferase involved in cell wall biosynthesis